MPGVLIDTSAWIEAIRRDGRQEVASRVQEALRAGEALFCELVLVELWNGARSQQDQRLLRQLEAELETRSIDAGVWARAKELARHCRASGLTLPAADLVIAACAEAHGLELLHCDGHVDQLREVSPP